MIFYNDAVRLNLCQVPQVYFSLKFEETAMIYDALGDILVEAQAFHRKSFPLAKQIQRLATVCLWRLRSNDVVLCFRNCVDFYAHESPAKCFRLPDHMIVEGNPNRYEVAKLCDLFIYRNCWGFLR